MTYAVSLGFASGFLFMTPASGGTPVRVGVLQDVAVDITFEEKLLYGQSQWATALARGKAKGVCKAKFAQIDSLAIGTIFFGLTPTTGQTVIYDLEPHAVPGSVAYAVQVSNRTGGISDLGVFYAATGQPLLQVAAGSEAVGKYSVAPSTGTYTFAAGDANAAILISYANAATSGNVTALTNQPLGTVNYFQVDLFQSNPEAPGSQWGMRLYRCASTKLALATKQDDWTIPEMDFSIQANAAGKVLDFNTPN